MSQCPYVGLLAELSGTFLYLEAYAIVLFWQIFNPECTRKAVCRLGHADGAAHSAATGFLAANPPDSNGYKAIRGKGRQEKESE